MTKIKRLWAREIIDSRGNPTIEVDLITENNLIVRSAIPSGASTGEYEALELRDKDKKRFMGKGVLNAVKNVNQIIAERIKEIDVEAQERIDKFLIELDATANKSRLGANAILAVSMAASKAASASQNKWLFEYLSTGKLLPCPFMNVINGGAHADNNLDIQEFMIVPGGFDSFKQALQSACEIFHSLKSILKSKGFSTSVGDEGGFAPNLGSHEEAIELILNAIEKAGYKPVDHVALALDVAASELYEDGRYHFKKSDKSIRDAQQMTSYYEKLINSYPIISIEDGLAEDDWDGWQILTNTLKKRIQIVGDDIFVTNVSRLKEGIKKGIANAILIKLNQIGTVTETIDAIKIAKDAGYGQIISHRSGETEDTTIAHFAVAFDTGMIKTGSVSRTDRTCKYNELLRIEEYLGKDARFAGFSKIVKG